MTDAIVTNEQDGKQSKIEGKPTEFPPLAFLEVSKVMGLGSEVYPREDNGTPNWHKIGCFSNLDHGLIHAAQFLKLRNMPPIKGIGNDDEEFSQRMLEELSHHAARACMALEQFIRGEL